MRFVEATNVIIKLAAPIEQTKDCLKECVLGERLLTAERGRRDRVLRSWQFRGLAHRAGPMDIGDVRKYKLAE